MKRLVAFVAAIAALATPTGAAAHPLGNFTVNRFSGITLSGEDVYVHYVLDLAEIPTYQEGDRVRAAQFPKDVGARLVLDVEGRRVELVPLQRKLAERPGAGGLPTLRFDAVFRAQSPGGAPRGETSLVFHDTNFADRIGWREVVVRADHGAAIEFSDVPAESESRELRSYPKEL